MNTTNIIRVDNILPEEERVKLLKWIVDNPLMENDGCEKRAFAIAFRGEDLPEKLSFFKHDKYNLYNCVFFTTTNNGYIEPHVDTDFLKFVKMSDKYNHIKMSLPSTVVYYVQVDGDMIGGELVVGDDISMPRENTTLEIGRGVLHSVRKIEHATVPRVAIACERYNIIPSYLDQIKTPIIRPG